MIHPTHQARLDALVLAIGRAVDSDGFAMTHPVIVLLRSEIQTILMEIGT